MGAVRVMSLEQHDKILPWLERYPADRIAEMFSVPQWVVQEMQKGKRLR